ncbi:YncE family protein [Edaphobacter sp. 12200R-103]|uniref:YncE family protein n=1 Tax=Edaphobacter sp. 12200R-103 TaxID=2703788 RepID=UPI00138B1FD7|nr:YncE family protein [Edaphobacter sp. 12200R-103]QHS53446.1 YncE family protein [Edaphobacter sp. 12200R-103]
MHRRLLKICFGLLALPLSQISVMAQASAPQTGLINRDASVFSQETGRIYLVDTMHDALVAIAASGASQTIKVGAGPVAVAINQKTARVYVVNAASRSVSVVDAKTGDMIASVPTAARPYAIAVDELSNRVYVSNTFSNMLTVIDGKTNRPKNLPVGSADAILVDSENRRVYLLGYESDTITELNPETGATTKLPAGAMHLWGMARAGQTLYVSHVQEKTIGAIDLQAHQVHTLPAGSMPCAVVVDPDAGTLYVANYADGTVSVIEKGGRSSRLKVSAWPQALSLDPGAHRLYVASPQKDTVTVIDTKQQRILRTYRGLQHPYAVAFSPVTHRAYAVNQGERAFTLLK